MKPIDHFDLPPEKGQALAKARKLEIVTLAYVTSTAVVIGLTMGSSQAMQTSFYEDIISTVPSVAFLVCSRIACWKPSREYPYGFHGAVSIGYLLSSLALVLMGGFLLFEAVMKLIHQERTTIGGIELFGHTIWAGWPMFAALVYACVPSIFLGRAKLRHAPRIHDKILHADAEMMKADWMSAVATAVGVLGVGIGLWWLDPLAAAVVSVSILKDGVTNMKVVLGDLIERRPMKTDGSGPEEMPDQLQERMEQLDWVESAEVRVRESGHVFFGEVFITPAGAPDDLPGKVRAAIQEARSINWRLHDVTVTVMREDERAASRPKRD